MYTPIEYGQGYYSKSLSYSRSTEGYDYTNKLISEIRETFSTRESKMLELGAGSGTVARLLKADGFNVDIVEPDPGYAELLKIDGFTVYSTIEEARAEYDLIYSIGVLEHLRDPMQQIMLWISMLSEGGLIIVQYPNVTGLSARLCLNRWDMLFEPGHISIPSLSGMTASIAGFGVVMNAFTSSILSRGRVPFLPFRSAGLESFYRTLCKAPLISKINQAAWGLLDQLGLGETIVVFITRNN